MSDGLFLVTKTNIVKAKNMKHARSLIDGEADVPGSVMAENLFAKEVNQEEASMYFATGQDSFYNTFDEVDSDESTPHLGSEDSVSNTIDFLRSENKRLARLALRHKNSSSETVDAVYKAAFDAFGSWEMGPVAPPVNKRIKGKTPETAVCVFSDWQLGKITPDYNSEVLEERIKLYTQKLLEITEIQRMDHEVNDLHVWFLGDIVEGEEIFPGQSHLIDSGLYRQVGVNGPKVISEFLRAALASFDRVHVTGVIGNHGAVGGKMRRVHDPETNMDRLLYKIVELMFSGEKRITFNIPDGKGERNWYAVDKIGDYSSLLIHGDQMPAPTSYHGYYKKVMGWKDGAIPEHFDDIFMGHYHQQFKITIGSSLLRISGSPESYNTYAQEYFSSMSRPCQHLMFIHPERGVTCEYSIWLDSV